MAKQKKEMTLQAAKVRAVLAIVFGAGSFAMLFAAPLFFVGLGCAVGALVSGIPLLKQPVQTYQILGVVGVALAVVAAGISAFS